MKQAEKAADSKIGYSYLRWSSARQRESGKRQIEHTKQWCQENGIELADVSFKDMGISAFSGANRKQGLGQFLEACESGLIMKGSWLIVESLDRISRQQIKEHLKLFLEILDHGIKIHTLSDNMTYDGNNLDVQNLLISISVMSRSHEESKVKSDRVSAAWHDKAKKAKDGHITTVNCPAWLEVIGRKSDGRYVQGGKFKKIPERVAIVKRIFELYIEGYGCTGIAKLFNHEKIPSFTTNYQPENVGWYPYYLRRILANRAVIGEYQPKTLKDGELVDFGDPVPGYFPEIISEDTFNQVQAVKRFVPKLEKTGKINNLFSGLIKCKCGSDLYYRASGHKQWVYLQCLKENRGFDCNARAIEYNWFERICLMFLANELSIADLTGNQEAINSKEERIKAKIHECRKQMDAIDAQVENWQYAIANYTGNNRERFMQPFFEKIDAALEQKDSLEKEAAKLDNDLSALMIRENSTDKKIKDIKELIELLANEKDMVKLYDIRAKLRDRLRSIIQAIYINDLHKTICIVFAGSRKARVILTEETGDLDFTEFELGRISFEQYIREFFLNINDSNDFKFHAITSDKDGKGAYYIDEITDLPEGIRSVVSVEYTGEDKSFDISETEGLCAESLKEFIFNDLVNYIPNKVSRETIRKCRKAARIALGISTQSKMGKENKENVEAWMKEHIAEFATKPYGRRK